MDPDIVASSLLEKLRNVAEIVHPMFKKQVQSSINNLNLLMQFLKEAEDHESSSDDSPNHQKMARLLQAVYSAEDAVDTLLVTKEMQRLTDKLPREREEVRREIKQLEREREEVWREIKQLQRKIKELKPDNEHREREEILGKRLSPLSDRESLLGLVLETLRPKVYEPLLSQITFTHEMKKLKNEVRALCFHDTRLKFRNNIEGGAGYNKNTSCGFRNDRVRDSQQPRWSRISDFCLEEIDVVVLDHQIKELVVRLIPDHNPNDGQSSEDIKEVGEQDQSHSTEVIVVFGEGGSGKTTLVKTVYDRVDVKRHFTNSAWVQVFNVFDVRDVLIDVLKQIDPAQLVVEETLTEADVISRINKLLKGTVYLIVVEVVGTVSQVWQALRHALCSSSYGSRIIIISRYRNGLQREAAYSTLHVGRLNNKKSLKLFLKKTRIARDDFYNLELVKLEDQILSICRGLPLRVVLLGGLLSTKDRSYHEWLKVIERANSIAGDILSLSYQDLPSAVKPCFLYLVVFPKGFEIPVRRLIRLWCAEGFTTSSSLEEEIDSEDLAEMYFEELVVRNMIQVVKWRLDGTPKTCRMPSLLYDAFYQRAVDAGFLYHQLQSSQPSTKRPPFTVRRLSEYLGANKISSNLFVLDVQHLRSYVGFDIRTRGADFSEGDHFSKIIDNRGFSVLKALDLEGVYKPFVLSIAFENLLQLKCYENYSQQNMK